MRKIYLAIIGCLLLNVMACRDWTEMEVKSPVDLTVSNKSEHYYQELRDYKKSDHQVAFGWFGNWAGTGSSYENSLKGLPDSVDFVSLWGGWKNLTPEKIKDLRYVQKKKGTKVLICFLVLDMGDQMTPPMPASEVEKGTTIEDWKHQFWNWSYDKEAQLAAVERYANAICDTIDKYGYDGFDLDAEPNQKHPFRTNKELWTNRGLMTKFIETMAKRIGPSSGTDKMLVIDGEPEAIPDTLLKHFDYLILQTYSKFIQDNSRLDEAFEKQYRHFSEIASPRELAKKLIICENFEDYAKSGGLTYNLPDGTTTNSLTGFALWNPTHQGVQYATKGGVGTFHMEYEYKVSAQGTQTYPALRRAIQLQNPSIK